MRSLANSGPDNITSRILNRFGDDRWKKEFGWENSPQKPPGRAYLRQPAQPQPRPKVLKLSSVPIPAFGTAPTQQRISAGTGQAAHQTDLGQCRADQRKHRQKARRIQRRHAANYQRGKNAGYPCMDSPRLAGRHRHASSGIRPLARRIGRHRNGVQRLRAAHQAKIHGLSTGAKVERIDGKYPFVATHTHQTIADRHLGDLDRPDVIQRPGNDNIDNRKLVRVGTLRQFIDDPRIRQKTR